MFANIVVMHVINYISPPNVGWLFFIRDDESVYGSLSILAARIAVSTAGKIVLIEQ